MKIKIVEPDTKYQKEFAEYLVGRGAKITDVSTVLEVPDDFQVVHFHGLVEFSAAYADGMDQAKDFLENYTGNFELFLKLKTQVRSSGHLTERQLEVVKNAIEREKPKANFISENQDVVLWLNNYRGDFPFYVSLQVQLRTRMSLSPKQVEAVRRAIARETSTPAPEVKKQFTLQAGEIIRVAKWFGKKVALEAGLVRPHYVMEVISVEAETEKAYRATLRLSAQRTSHCCICGLALTDPRSVMAGIGPICGNSYEISFGENSLAELSEKLRTTKNVTTWFPKVAIKEKGAK